jgi:hypothetical protein
VTDDGAVDVLTGGAGTDWWFVRSGGSSADQALDAAAGEKISTL